MKVVIIGGGCAGVLTAIALLRAAADGPLDATIVEPAELLGDGVAYATRDPLHLLNVPADRLGAHVDDVGGFWAWARRELNPATALTDFLPRARYGDYLRDALRRAHTDAGGTVVRHVRAHAVAVEDGSVLLDDDRRLAADQVVLAVGPPPGRPPAWAAADPDVHAGPWSPGALEPTSGTVLLVGSGLTAVDAALSLAEARPDVIIRAVSRSGETPRAHRPVDARVQVDLPTPPWAVGEPPRRVDELERMLRAYAAEATALGGTWRDAIDAIRHDVPRLWQALPVDEQRRFLFDRVRAWDVHRHRMAPGVHARWRSLIDSGRVRIDAARVDRVWRDEGGRLHAVLQPSDGGVVEDVAVERIILCMGLGVRVEDWDEPLIQTLLKGGRITPDVHGIGIRAQADGAVITAGDAPDPELRVIGALRRGELWESTAVPELRAQAAVVASAVLSATRRTPVPQSR